MDQRFRFPLSKQSRTRTEYTNALYRALLQIHPDHGNNIGMIALANQLEDQMYADAESVDGYMDVTKVPDRVVAAYKKIFEPDIKGIDALMKNLKVEP